MEAKKMCKIEGLFFGGHDGVIEMNEGSLLISKMSYQEAQDAHLVKGVLLLSKEELQEIVDYAAYMGMGLDVE